jgi:isopentenyl-diphosphate Delta-isomerase
MAEWLDIVNQYDEVIGRATRDEIHRENHFHRSAHIALFNSCGEVFVQLRSKNKDNDPGLWDTSAAGHVDSGESYLDCAIRELDEELGVQVSAEVLQLVGHLHPDPGNGFEFTRIYTACSDQSLVLQTEEVDDGVWMRSSALDAWMDRDPDVFTGVFRTIWPIVRNHAE